MTASVRLTAVSIHPLSPKSPRLASKGGASMPFPIWKAQMQGLATIAVSLRGCRFTECQSCVQAPISALFQTGNDWVVFEVDGGRVRQQADTIGHMNEDVAEVAGGLEPGTTVVVHPNEA